MLTLLRRTPLAAQAGPAQANAAMPLLAATAACGRPSRQSLSSRLARRGRIASACSDALRPSMIRLAARKARWHSSAPFAHVTLARLQMNDLLSLGQHRVWKRMAVSWSGAAPGSRVLDACCGSGDLTFRAAEAAGPSGQVGPVVAAQPPEQGLEPCGQCRLRARRVPAWQPRWSA